jgi:hypothetical protein
MLLSYADDASELFLCFQESCGGPAQRLISFAPTLYVASHPLHRGQTRFDRVGGGQFPTEHRSYTQAMHRQRFFQPFLQAPGSTRIEVYAPRQRSEWLGKIVEAGVRRRAEHYYQQLDVLRLLRQEVRRDLLAESKKHKAWKLLRQIPGIGPIRAALLVALIQTPHRFRTK